MKPIKTVILFLIILCILVGLCGCLYNTVTRDGMAWIENFEDYEKGEIYTCSINPDTSFWYSPFDMYGEWTRGETVIPVKLNYDVDNTLFSELGLALDFFDTNGCRIGKIRLVMNNDHLHNTSRRVECVRLDDTVIFNTEYQELLEEQWKDLTWEGIVIKKVKKQVETNASVFQPLEEWRDSFSDEMLICQTGGFWFSFADGVGYWENSPVQNENLKFTVTYHDPLPHKNYYDYEGLDYGFLDRGPSSESCVRLFIIDSQDSTILQEYEIFADEEGYYIWLESEEDPIKARLTKSTSDTDPRRDFLNFMQGEDKSGNAFTFTCEQGHFSYTGRLGIGVWENEGETVDIKVSIGKLPLEIIMTTLSNSTETETLLQADFVKMVDANTARFKIRSDFIGGEIFADPNETEFYRIEFYVTKQPAATTEDPEWSECPVMK